MALPRQPLAALALAACLAIASFASATPTTPQAVDASNQADDPVPIDERWDPRVRELVRFVEDLRGPISRPARLEFIDRSELVDELRGRPIPQGESNPIGLALSRLDDADRALGLTDAEWSQEDIAMSLGDSVAAFYDPAGPRIVVAIDGDEPTKLDLPTRVILTHELVHAFQGASRLRQAWSLRDPGLAQALIEGEAEWVLEKYVDTLEPEEQRAWRDFVAERRSTVRTSASIIDARLGESYELGYRLHRAAHYVRGDEMFDALLGGARAANRSSRSLLDPYDFETDAIGAFAHSPPDSAIDFDAVGIFYTPMTWYRVFATAVSPADALDAARSVTSVRSPDTRLRDDGSLCVTSLVLAGRSHRADVLDAAEAWAARLPTHRSARLVGLDIELDACDPGAGFVPEPVTDPLGATVWLARFIDAEAWLIAAGRDRAMAPCLVQQLGDGQIGFSIDEHERRFAEVNLDRC